MHCPAATRSFSGCEKAVGAEPRRVREEVCHDGSDGRNDDVGHGPHLGSPRHRLGSGRRGVNQIPHIEEPVTGRDGRDHGRRQPTRSREQE